MNELINLFIYFIVVFTSARPLQLQVLHAVDVSTPSWTISSCWLSAAAYYWGFRSFVQNLVTLSSTCIPS